jgi:esterase/lipase
VFLAVTLDLDKMGVHQHRYIRGDQVHLLTDDRFNKFKNFISMAQEKGILKKDKNTLEKDSSRFGAIYDFHRVRIDNPVEVMANEVEPLTLLQRSIRRLAWQPGFYLKRRIANYLTNKAMLQFEKDFKKFHIEGESKDKAVGMPFLLKNRSKKVGVVLVHGYMAAPPEVRELADYLNRKGFWVYAPRLRGHGTSPDDLAGRTYMDWVESVDEGYAIVSNICRRVVVGGFSTGAGLALDLAARVKDLAGVFAVSPPLRLLDFSSRFVPAVDVWNRCMGLVRLDAAKKEFSENRPENPHINYFRNPICAVRELGLLMDALEPKLSNVEQPALVIQSAGDPLVDPKGSRRIYELLGSRDKEYILFNFDRHGILLGDGAHRVHRAIGNFIQSLQ